MKKKILCIDDSAHLRQSIKKQFQLEMDEVEVLLASSGKEGIFVAQTEQPDLILLDISMPTMDGREVLRELKKAREIPEGEYATCDIPVIILTGHGPEERELYLSLGAIDYFFSPYDASELVATVRRIVNTQAS